MNCQEISEILMDLLYDELPSARRREALDHIAACSQCAGEYSRLQKARGLLKLSLAGEPSTVRAAQALEAASDRKTIKFPWKLVLVGSAVAAAAIIIMIAFLLPGPGVNLLPEAYAQGPVKIERTNVSVTILSQPPEWGQLMPGREMMRAQQAAPGIQGQALQMQADINMPLWHDRYGRVVWPGMALVRDQRLIVNLPQGNSRVQFTDVPTGIMPDTVRLRSLDEPDGLKILEQNYQYDLASSWAILKKFVDNRLTVSYKDGNIVTGKLLSFDDKTLVISPDQPKRELESLAAGALNIARREIKSIAFDKLPGGLMTRPTLLWELSNAGRARQQLEVAYMTTGLQWRADYVLKLRPAGAPVGANVVTKAATTAPMWKKSDIPDFIDHADLVGYATVSNASGVTYKNAQLKLIAGDVHLIPPPGPTFGVWAGEHLELDKNGKKEQQFAEKSFFEYHLYTLQNPATIADREVKQLELVSRNGIAMQRNYVFDPQANATAARVVSEMENSEENGLGVPLPKGVMRLYAPDPEGVDQYVADTEIDHTPVKEKLRLAWGYAFDIACEARQTGREGYFHSARKDIWEYRLRNHKDSDVNVTVIARVPMTAIRATCNFPWHVREVGVVEIFVPVKANTQSKVDFSVEYDIDHGGGLKSPYDENNKK